MTNEYKHFMQSNWKLQGNHLDKIRITSDILGRKREQEMRTTVRMRVNCLLSPPTPKNFWVDKLGHLVSFLIYIESGFNECTVVEKLLLDIGLFIVLYRKNLNCCGQEKEREYSELCGISTNQKDAALID